MPRVTLSPSQLASAREIAEKAARVMSNGPDGLCWRNNDDWEPGPIATLKSGGYVALDHCEMSDFCEMRPLQSNDKEQNHE